MKKYILLGIIFLLIPLFVHAKSGCCSWHGGVSYCAENGRYVCNDGTYSPSCTCTPTITYHYGCMDPNAINYNSNANRDDGSCIQKVLGCMNANAINYNSTANTSDGSCQFSAKEEHEEIIPFTTKEEIGTKEEVKQKGIDGKKVITTEIITDESGNVLSSTIIEEKTTIEPVEQIVVKVKEEEEKSKESTNENSSSSSSGFIGLGIAGLITYMGYKYKNHH